MKPKPVAYLDADIILYRAASFCEKEFDGEEAYDVKQAMYYFDHFKTKWLKELGPVSDYFLVLSVGGNFRKSFFPEYKANRKDITPHPVLHHLKQEVMTLAETIWEEGIEADDLIGIRCTEDPNTVAVSADKDFATVPCRLMIPSSHSRTSPDWYTFTEDEANMNWMRQSMTGDTIDNYKGIPGVGIVKATKVVPEPAPLSVVWPKVLSAFVQAGQTEEQALTMVRLARILRHGDYNFDTKEVNLWNP